MLNGTFFRSPPTETKQVVERLNNAGKADKETEALRALVKRMVEHFRDEQRPSYFGEAAMLAEVASGNEYQTLIFAFSRAITAGTADGSPVDLDLLKFFACSLRQSKDRIPRETARRFGAVLGGLSKHMSNAQNFADLETQYFLLCTINVVLDAMVDINFSGIDRETLYSPLTEKLRDLSNDSEPRMAQAARYAFQALSRIPDNEGPWQAFFRTSGTAINAITKISSGVATMDPKKFVDAAPDIIELCRFFKKVVEMSRDALSASDDIRSLITGMQDAAAQHGWYDALRQTDVLIESGAYDILKRLIPGLPCLQEKLFWCGLYAQLEQCWVDDKPSKHGAVDFIEWTFGQPSLMKLSSKHRSVQDWIRFLAYTFHQPSWGKQLSKPKRKLPFRLLPDKEQVPTLKSCFQYRQPHYDQYFPLLQVAMRGCKEAQLFYADATLSQHYTREGRLDIERLSGERAPIDTCYINLALIENTVEEKRSSEVSEFSLFERLKIENKVETDVPLADLFKPRKLGDGTTRRPSRILIRGRAGVGKTTLCKKIIHDFLYHRLWKTYFDRVFWIPLRKLKDQDSLERFLKENYFENTLEKTALFPTLWDTVCDENRNRTLFILDGLDEIIGYQRPEGSLIESFERVLNRNNVVITSRPYAVYPSQLKRYDLEVETTGFRDHQIESYLNQVVKDHLKISQIRQFIAQHWLIQGLIRIPIQLDALCFTWDEELSSEKTLSTMTDLYGAIEKKLWHKDMVSLEKNASGRLLTGHTAQKYKTRQQIKCILSSEMELLELMAFLGIYHNITEFKWGIRSKVYDQVEGATDDCLDRISFLRSSDSSLSSADRNYYFIHLTFQEYFAAQYFVKRWKLGLPLQCLQLKHGGSAVLQPEKLIDQEKYNGRYDIMWRFVSGLLETEGEEHLVRFIERVESEPRDLLGPVHSRLLMRCFSELTLLDNNSTIQHVHATMKRQLPRLLLFEGKMGRRLSGLTLDPPWGSLYSTALLGTEMEFPEQILEDILDKGCITHQQIVLEALTKRPQVSPRVLGRVITFLEPSHTVGMRKTAARVIGNNPEFSIETTKKLIEDNSGWRVPRELLIGLCRHPKLPEDMIQMIITRLSNREADTELIVMKNQLSLAESIVQRLAHVLQNGNPLAKARAVVVLVAHSLLEKSMMEDVATLLCDPDEKVRRIIFSAFKEQLPPPKLILEAAVANMNETKYLDSMFISNKILQEQDTWPMDVVEGMWRKIERGCNRVRDLAFEILQKEIAPSPDAWIELYNTSTFKDAVSIAVTKGHFRLKLDPPEVILEHCVSVLRTKGPDLKEYAASALAESQCLPVKILDTLAQHLRDRVQSVRRYSVIAFGHQSNLSHEYVKALASLLQEEGQYMQEIILRALGSRSTLPPEILRKVIPFLTGHTHITGKQAVSILCKREILSQKSLQSVASLLRSRKRNTRINAERVLRKCADLGDLLYSSDVETWVALFKCLLERSFNECILCSVQGNYLCIDTPEGFWKVSIEHPEQWQKLDAAIKAAHDELDYALDGSGNSHSTPLVKPSNILEIL
ncbi:hypothetical protein ETB97_000692 [Aspergillus alliaceus]|uniref:NACHT domain-containing protein n=1 Tax=Petromyces alliaceus TaxID=209559 RepID=A0A8H6AGZ6_PETAA|nr:hypothetical protein ETB97_000692 [Aspergillus burnettii]